MVLLQHLGRGGVAKSVCALADKLAIGEYAVEIVTLKKENTVPNKPSSRVSHRNLNKDCSLLARARMICWFPREFFVLLLPFIVPLKPCNAQSFLRSLAQYVAEEKPDILISAKPYCNIIAAMAVSVSNHTPKLILTEHTSLSQDIASR